MGWSIHVAEVVMHVPTCLEDWMEDCPWIANPPAPTSRHEAERLVDEHRAWHVARYAAMNAEVEGS